MRRKGNEELYAVQPTQEFIECVFEEFESFDSSTSNNHKHTRNHNQLRNLAIMCDRYQISDRAGAAIANAVLQDYGIITQEEGWQIIDRNKLRRSRFSVRKVLANEAHETINEISAIYFDGRNDQTGVLVERKMDICIRKLQMKNIILSYLKRGISMLPM
ncbi:hypothetical protein LOD99_1562 [Oopsacas minuta]|uniref:Uncharacterized protein n=1 Tax=Oopsacas minuta TaxID=111878 RepID=A0AAV7K629_9METZ|nr:hypothetical protein LOD99_1562 [Oopsacas minuta]